jgi:hypothetical protein
LHWHGDTFDSPLGATRLAESRGCINQAFAAGAHVIAFQFHLETTAESTPALIDECHSDLAPGTFVQTPAEMLKSPERFDQPFDGGGPEGISLEDIEFGISLASNKRAGFP